jgi:hypothetical protein
MNMNTLFPYALWTLIGMIVLGSSVAVLVW